MGSVVWRPDLDSAALSGPIELDVAASGLVRFARAGHGPLQITFEAPADAVEGTFGTTSGAVLDSNGTTTDAVSHNTTLVMFAVARPT